MKEYRLTDWLPTTKKEVELRGWDELDVILFSGDAYVDHPSFGAAVIGRILEAEGLRVAIIPQPNWRDDLRDFKKLGRPRLFFGISPGCMDSMVNKYTANKRLRSDDAYTPDDGSGVRVMKGINLLLDLPCGNPYNCISFYRQQQRRGEHTSLDSLYGLEAEDSETTKRLKEMYRLIAGLDKFERAVILLWLDENSYEEIAEIGKVNATPILTPFGQFFLIFFYLPLLLFFVYAFTIYVSFQNFNIFNLILFYLKNISGK